MTYVAASGLGWAGYRDLLQIANTLASAVCQPDVFREDSGRCEGPKPSPAQAATASTAGDPTPRPDPEGRAWSPRWQTGRTTTVAPHAIPSGARIRGGPSPEWSG